MEQRRIKVEGWSDSDIHMKVVVLQAKTGEVHLAIEGIEPSVQNLAQIRMLLDEVCKKIDGLLPQLVTNAVAVLNK